MEVNLDKTRKIPMDEIGKHDNPNVEIEKFNVPAEAFANEILDIIVHSTNEEGSLDVITPSVNGVNQPIVRGRIQPVKRKYVEALARARITKYTQELGDQRDPASLRMVERTVLAYPFDVRRDPNPKGAAWLQGILAS